MKRRNFIASALALLAGLIALFKRKPDYGIFNETMDWIEKQPKQLPDAIIMKVNNLPLHTIGIVTDLTGKPRFSSKNTG